MNPRASNLASLLVICSGAASLPACVFSAGNRANARDVDRTVAEPPQPDSRFVLIPYVDTNPTEMIYQAPPDRAFMIRDLRITTPCDVIADVAGNQIVLFPMSMLHSVNTSPIRHFAFQSAGALKLPPGASLHVRPVAGPSSKLEQVGVFVAGELVRLQ